MSEAARERAEKYVQLLESVIPTVVSNPAAGLDEKRVERARETVTDYLKDAKYYLQEDKPTTALASVAYAEGILDCLAILGIVSVAGGRFAPKA